ncbi:MAG: hypothetical protein Q9176_004464 [Flavoplaca citrina]
MLLQSSNADGATTYSPTSTASLVFPLASQNFSKTLSALKQSTLSITNRLSSIHQDALFVQQIADHYKLPLVANERCGSWYIPPESKVGSAYFKSTDGHQGQWSFSTRRLNLQILELVADHEGCIIVDSTRRGKSMPDALSKTVPIWCAVMNRLLFDDDGHDDGLNTPMTVVSRSEQSQIESRLNAFVLDAKRLQLDTASLRQRLLGPLRPFYVTPDYPFPDLPSQAEQPYHPIICLTTSRRVHGTENSERNYIQGAGDDSESWSHGLTPELFWRHKDNLMSTTEAQLPSLIASLVNSLEDARMQSESPAATLIPPTSSIYIGSIGSIDSDTWDVVVCCNRITPSVDSQFKDQNDSTKRKPRLLHLPVPQGKLGSRALRTQLHLLAPFLQPVLRTNPNDTPAEPLKILFTCPSGTDLAVGAALVALCLFFDDDGNRRDFSEYANKHGARQTHGENLEGNGITMDKVFIKRRLAWISTAKPDARPSRETLQAVNICLMGR